MNKSDRLLLEGMDARELADIGISRGDLPRLFAEAAIGRCVHDFFVCDMPPATKSKLDCTPHGSSALMLGEFAISAAANRPGERGNPVASGRWKHHDLRMAIVRAGSAVSAVLITWAIVYGLAPLQGES